MSYNESAYLPHFIIPDQEYRMTDSDLLAGIMDRTVNPIQAYITRKLKVTGKMDDLLRLQKLL